MPPQRSLLFILFVVVAASFCHANCPKRKPKAEAIFVAVEEGEPELVKCIIKNGGNVNFVVKKDGPNKGRTPLMEAARRGHDKLAEILIKEDANPDIQDVRGKTALMYAAHRGELEVVNALIGAGARTDIVDMDGRDARRIAQEMHYDEIVYVLNTVALTGNSPRTAKGTSSSIKDKTSSAKGKVKNNKGSWGNRRLRGFDMAM